MFDFAPKRKQAKRKGLNSLCHRAVVQCMFDRGISLLQVSVNYLAVIDMYRAATLHRSTGPQAGHF